MTFKKNTAVTGFPFLLVSATDGSAITTGTPVGYVTLDGGTQTAIGDVTPVHEGNGQWTFDLTAAEMNGDVVGFLITHTSAVPVHFTIKTDTKIVSELNDLTAAQVNAECDTAITDAALATAANLATVDTVVDAILVDTDATIPALIAALNDPTAAAIASAVLTTAMTESYATDGSAPTLTQALMAIQQFLQERAASGTTLTVKKLDGSTTAMTFTLNDATSPTSITRAT